MSPQVASSPSEIKRDRLPPYSEEAERGVLGSILLDAERVIDLCIERQLAPESFYVHAHRTLYEVLVDMNQDNSAVDLLTVATRIIDRNLSRETGGEAFIEALVDATPTSAHAEYYIDIVHQKHVLRTIIDRAREAIGECYSAEQDAELVLGNTEQAFFEISDMQHSGITPWPELVKHTMVDIESIYQQKKGLTGIPTGFQDLDRVLLGFQPGDMVIIAARPSMGKTSLALNMVEHIALGTNADHKPRCAAVFSLEMSTDQLVRRMLCCKAKVSAHKIATGFVSKENHGKLMQSADALSKAQVILDDTAGLSALELRSRARRLKRKYDVDIIFVDYLQLMHYPQFSREGRQRETAAISGTLKAMAKELKIPVVVLSQLSRAPETRDRLARPKLSDLRDSGSIEQDADVVCLLRRPCKYPDDEESADERLAMIDVAKHRNGPTGEVRLNFVEDFMRFEDRVKERGVDGSYDDLAPDDEGDVV